MQIVAHRKLFYILSGLILAASVLALALWGLKPGIDFKGGSLFEVTYPDGRPEKTEIETSLAPFSVDASVRPTGDKGFIIRMKDLTEGEQTQVREAVSFNGAKRIVEKRFDSVGPLLGKEAVGKSFLAIALVILCIVIFITFAFRHVSEPVASWKYGIITIVALLHDVLVPTGAFAILGHYAGFEVDTLFVTALLVVLGFSVHDTIVVFDRVRENLRVSHEARDRKDFSTIVGESIEQTFVRSINTSLTTVIALIVLYFIGPEVTKHFSLALLIGIIAGTYSSIFIGSPLLVTVEKWQERKNP
ncbi:MAG: preprotein translocase subunit SecF [Parcubacteria group bacterium Greene0416_79]|nr:MAG: preprotein translocase subunit SecF [Parcubacteria group bacterium Greene0416_79]